MVSRTRDSEYGTEIIIDENGTAVTEKGSPLGTYFSVSDLFYNVPARAKFLKSDSQEESEITNLLTRLILSNPSVSFRYTADSKTVFQSDGKGFRSAVFAVYGKTALENSIELSGSREAVGISRKGQALTESGSVLTLSGIVGRESFSKHNRTYQTLILNGRYIQNKTVSSAVSNAFGGRLMTRQYPFWILNLTVPVDFVDVNVHPNKLDVRFRDNSLVYDFVYKEVNMALSENTDIKEIKEDSLGDFIVKSGKQDKKQGIMAGIKHETTPKSTIMSDIINPPHSKKVNTDIVQGHGSRIFSSPRPYEEVSSSLGEAGFHSVLDGVRKTKYTPHGALEKLVENKNLTENNNTESRASENTKSKVSKNTESKASVENIQDSFFAENDGEGATGESNGESSSGYKIAHVTKKLGVLFNTYLLFQSGDNFYLLDQHAAHERFLYDKLERLFDAPDTDSQPMLLPFVFDCNALEKQYLLENMADFEKLGFEISAFGGGSFKFDAIPAVLSGMDFSKFLGFIFSDLSAKNRKKTVDLFRTELMQKACKAAFKGGESIPEQELDELLKNIAESKTTPLCPHGRPIAVKIKKETVEKWFKRIV
jgi:DNA mismatch repair protein MutL